MPEANFEVAARSAALFDLRERLFYHTFHRERLVAIPTS